jgi:outer membrane immunogenic protein
MIRRYLAAGVAAAALAFGGVASAGTLAAPVTEPVVAAPAPVVAMRDPWTGPYVGAQLGWGELGLRFRGEPGFIDPGADVARLTRSGWLGGLHIGYLQGFGNWAAGIEGSYDHARIRLPGGARVSSVAALKLRAGPTFDNFFLYGTVGVSNIRLRGGGESSSDSGWLAGIGGEVRLDDNWRVGAEILQHRIRNFDSSGVRVRLTTAQLRVSYRF